MFNALTQQSQLRKHSKRVFLKFLRVKFFYLCEYSLSLTGVLIFDSELLSKLRIKTYNLALFSTTTRASITEIFYNVSAPVTLCISINKHQKILKL